MCGSDYLQAVWYLLNIVALFFILFLILALALFLFGWNEMRCFNSLQVFLFIGERCNFLQEWMMDVNEWVIFTKFLITLIFNFLNGVGISQDQRNQFQNLRKCSTASYTCLGCIFEFFIYLNLHIYLNLDQPIIEKFPMM